MGTELGAYILNMFQTDQSMQIPLPYAEGTNLYEWHTLDQVLHCPWFHLHLRSNSMRSERLILTSDLDALNDAWSSDDLAILSASIACPPNLRNLPKWTFLGLLAVWRIQRVANGVITRFGYKYLTEDGLMLTERYSRAKLPSDVDQSLIFDLRVDSFTPMESAEGFAGA